MWCRVGPIGINVLERHVASIFKIERISELETLAAISKLTAIFRV
jgi:hypothetical protein